MKIRGEVYRTKAKSEKRIRPTDRAVLRARARRDEKRVARLGVSALGHERPPSARVGRALRLQFWREPF
jgi:hypothetical protein